MMHRTKSQRPPRNLREWLHRKGWQQQELAAHMGVSPSHVHYWLRGQKVTLRHAIALKRVTGLPVENLTPEAASLSQ